ncbi:UNVERIFIED_CONTAM: hypothetical protein FKN15_012183 [Acipenser sinensis]
MCFSTSAASSGVALGSIPGSLKLVCSKEITTKKKRTAPITGMVLVKCSTRNGQLRKQSQHSVKPGHRDHALQQQQQPSTETF